MESRLIWNISNLEAIIIAKPCRDHDIKISPTKGDVSVLFNGKTIARSGNALGLVEANYPVVIYMPLSDVDEKFLYPSDHITHCPFKGDASYYSLKDDGVIAENAVWYYADPCPLVEKIKNHVAFWGDAIEYVVKSQLI